MADETENETPETPEAPEAAEPQAAEPEAAEPQAAEPEAAEPEAAEPEAAEPEADDAPEAQADEAQDASAEKAPAAAEETPAAGGGAPAAEPAEKLSPKEKRRRERSRHEGSAKPVRSAEERHAERLQLRAVKAKRRSARRSQERAKAAERRASAPAREPLPPVHAPVEGARRERQGIVVSDKAEKTITVRIDIARRHRRYEKIVRSSSTLHAHDENNDAHIGDVVRVIESRPLSKTKRWALVDVLERAR